jgi:hypothetical protein
MYQQRLVAKVAPLPISGPKHAVRVASRPPDLQYPALHRDRPGKQVAQDKDVLQSDPHAKYAVAFSRMSHSTFTHASSARSRLIFIFPALTGLLSWP